MISFGPCRQALLPLLLGIAVASCATRPINEPIDTRDVKFAPSSHWANKTDPSFGLVVAFSGGGTRAAAFSYGVLEELRRTLVGGPQPRRLLDDVDVITGVSGGSFTALSYALYGERLFTEYEPSFLKRDVQGYLIKSLFNPIKWFALASATYGRSELAADFYDDVLFHKATFRDIIGKPDAPDVIVSATDITTGSRFTFQPRQFNVICSDLLDFPLSRAAAASSAVPVALSAVTLNNYALRCGPPAAERLREITGHGTAAMAGRARLQFEETSLLEDPIERPYIHLVDGGVSDNLGLRGVIETLSELEQNAGYRKFLRVNKLRRLAVIIVNSVSDPATDWDRSEAPPGMTGQMLKASTIPIDRYSYEQIESLNDIIQRWSFLRDRRRLAALEGNKVADDDSDLPDVEFYPIEITFQRISDPKVRAYYMNLPTSFALEDGDVDKLRAIAGELMRANPLYRKLLRDLGATSGQADSAQ